MRTANLAIVFTDIAGFTERTARQSHAENERLLRAHAALLEPVFRAFEGRIVKRIGDAYLVVFASPTKAVLCGAAIEDRLWDYNQRAVEALRLHVRVAVNVGEVRLSKGDVFGAPVNIAARVEAVAQPGEVLFTDAVWLAMDRGEVPSVERGRHQLRGVPDPVRLYSLPRSSGDGPPYARLGLSRAGKLPAVDARRIGATRSLPRRALASAGALALSAIVLWGGSLRARQPAPRLPPSQPLEVAQLGDRRTPPPPAVPKALRQLLAQLKSTDCDARARAAEELGRLGDRRAVRPLRALAEAKSLSGESEAHSIFECSSRGAAKDALAKLHF